MAEQPWEEEWKGDQFNWLLPLFAVLGTLLIFTSLILWSFDFGGILYLFVVIPLTSLVLIGLAIARRGRRRLSVLSMLIVFGTLSWLLWHHDFQVRSIGRWILLSKSYKAEVLAQPNSANGELKHVEWDGYGFAGMDTVVYLVFDPNDSLTKKSRSKTSSLPCEVPQIIRLQRNWYSVMFYTESSWGDCDPYAK
jgi:hypothetical protein